MQVNLIVCGARSRTVAVKSSAFLIGRAEDCDLRIESPLVSRHHCMLTVRDGQVYARDLHSSNGTGLNNRVLVGQQPVDDGDTLWVAVTPIEVHIRKTEVAGRVARALRAAWAPIRSAAASAAPQDRTIPQHRDWLPGNQSGSATTTRSPSSGRSGPCF